MIDDERVLRLPRGLSLRVAAVVADSEEGYRSTDEFLLEAVRQHLDAAERRIFRRRQELRP